MLGVTAIREGGMWWSQSQGSVGWCWHVMFMLTRSGINICAYGHWQSKLLCRGIVDLNVTLPALERGRQKEWPWWKHFQRDHERHTSGDVDGHYLPITRGLPLEDPNSGSMLLSFFFLSCTQLFLLSNVYGTIMCQALWTQRQLPRGAARECGR